MPVEIEWKLRAPPFAESLGCYRVSIWASAGLSGSVWGGLCCTLPASVVQNSVVHKTD